MWINFKYKNYALQVYEASLIKQQTYKTDEYNQLQDLLKSKLLYKPYKDFEVLLPKEQFILPGYVKCYILPYMKCESKYDPVSQDFGSHVVSNLEYLNHIWKKIEEALDIIKKEGWYANGDIGNICFTGKEENSKMLFTGFDYTFPAKKLTEFQESDKIREINEHITGQTLDKLSLSLRYEFIYALGKKRDIKRKHSWAPQ
ncbi:hypothetical protein BDF19DRAFT_413597 [Syncephalis fuscata]|nr:hypothetical protein BDF19DRAFT_413597 [Syncephalis fuscata]